MKEWAEGKNQAYIYTRYGNPTLTVAEEKLAALEGADAAVVTSSGMAAISSALLGALRQGDEVISTAQLYGGTYRLMRDLFPDMGITVRQVATSLEGQSNYRTIEELQSNLDPDMFWRVHRSYLVNIHRIKEVIPWFKSSYQIRMDDKKQTEIPVSRVQTKRLRTLLRL